MTFDCIVVGGGAAGLSAALVLGRARRTTLLLDAGGQSNRAAEHVGGLLGHDGTPPAELYARGRVQLEPYDAVEARDAVATAAARDGDGFAVTLEDGSTEHARTLLLATGLDYVLPEIPGVAEHWGRSVHHCPFCDGWEVRDKRLAVIASAPAVEHQEPLLHAWSDDVVRVEHRDVAGVRTDGTGRLDGLLLHDGGAVDCDAVFVQPDLRLRGTLHEQLGLDLTEQGIVAVDALRRASVPGVYAAGDAAVAPQQVVLASASGHLAATAIVRELVLGRDA